MLNYDAVKNWDFGPIVQTYTQRDSMLYALGLGIGADAVASGELRYVYEKDLCTVPTMATVLGSPGFWWRDARTGVDWVKLVHGEQAIRVFKPLPTAATIVAHNRVMSITDKGAGRGAIAVIKREIREQSSGELLAEVVHGSFLRGEGGYSVNSDGGSAAPSDPGPPALPAPPDGAPHLEVELATLEQQALIYRLSGDYNPLHADPDVARAAGFKRPILHGLCTYGMAAHAVLRVVTAYDAARLRSFAVRFTSPVFPGETIRFQLWERDSASFHLRARVDARDVVVLNNGLVELV
ncbi:MAG TPA: MaoC/PaaZ C-terminal domain-containing protein [Steroidobacteraceae bacterium]|nr:MaoC/PaaZ C-terminal domain-containing protein [Steroidobacteraceae bacterium]